MEQEQQLKKIQKLFSQIKCPYDLDQSLLGKDTRIRMIEYLLSRNNNILYEYYQSQVDYNSMESRIRAIKLQILQSGIWGQSKYGKNVDLNKLIDGNCSMEQSIQFIKRLAKPKNSQMIITSSEKENEEILDQQIRLFKDCLDCPYEIIKKDANPFPLGFTKSDQFEDLDKETLVEELDDMIKIQSKKNQYLNECLEGVNYGEDLSIERLQEKKLVEYSYNLERLNGCLQELNNHQNKLEMLKKDKELEDEFKYSIEFPAEYQENLTRFKQLQSKQ